jgi:HSP20 family molecular chaperone IbpA
MGARLDNGVLRLEIPRRDSVGQDVRRIEISS